MRNLLIVLAVMGVLAMTPTAFAADEGAAPAKVGPTSLWFTGSGAALLGAAVGAGLVVMGGAAGIGRVGGSAVESMARQPEAAGSINLVAMVTAAMIEGATLFAVAVCFLAVLWGQKL